MELPTKLHDDIWDYCRLNKITDIDGFIVDLTRSGFTVEKYGTSPVKLNVEPEIIEKEVIKEVEKIVEIEKIVEVEKIVEKEVIREVAIADTEYIDKLKLELEDKDSEILSLTEKLEVSNNNSDTESLLNKIKNLEMELELEQNRHKVQPKNEKIFDTKPKKNNIINWVKSIGGEDKEDDIYGEN